MACDGVNDVTNAFVGFVVGVKHTGSLRAAGHAQIEVGEVSRVHAGPVIVAVTDHPNQPICCVFQQIRNDPAVTAIDDSRPHDHGADPGTSGFEYQPLMFRPPRDKRCRSQRRVLGHGRRGITQHPHTGGVYERRGNAGPGATGHHSEKCVDRLTVNLLTQHRAVERRVHDDVCLLCRRRVGRRLGEIADDRMRSTPGNELRLLGIAHERGHIVARSHERLEHRRSDVPGTACHEDLHGGRLF